jgi:hypothetical protein
MGILLGFAPFIAFAILDWVMGPTQGLIAGALVSLALLSREWFSLKRVPKVLEIGTTILFGGLALYAVSGAPTWSIVGVRLRVDVGLLLIVLVSIAIRRPFTLQYAKEQVPREMWDTPRFRRINYVISAVWAVAFMALVSADLIMLEVPSLPSRVGVLITIVALVGAIKFTGWYPERQRAKASG